jgi:hypothetical protein
MENEGENGGAGGGAEIDEEKTALGAMFEAAQETGLKLTFGKGSMQPHCSIFAPLMRSTSHTLLTHPDECDVCRRLQQLMARPSLRGFSCNERAL